MTIDKDNNTIEKDWDFEQELAARQEIAKKVMIVVDSFLESIAFFKKTTEEIMMDKFRNKMSVNYLVFFLKNEASNVLSNLQFVNNILRSSMLPLTDDMTFEKYKEQTTILVSCPHELLINAKYPEVKALFNIINDITNEFEFYHLYKHGFSDKELNDRFLKMKSEWEKENKNNLECYIKDIYDYKEAVRDLRKEYKDAKAVAIWHDCGRNIGKTIDKMGEAKCTELDLLPLIRFSVKYDMLQEKINEIEEEPPKININHFHAKGSINIENIENVDKLDRI